jgi:hypothetical protein
MKHLECKNPRLLGFSFLERERVCGRKCDHLSENPFLFSFSGMLMRVLLLV